MHMMEFSVSPAIVVFFCKAASDFHCLWATSGFPRPAFVDQVPVIGKNVLGSAGVFRFDSLAMIWCGLLLSSHGITPETI
jgi:hypothetical protein